jgi:hypothetical protein
MNIFLFLCLFHTCRTNIFIFFLGYTLAGQKYQFFFALIQKNLSFIFFIFVLFLKKTIYAIRSTSIFLFLLSSNGKSSIVEERILRFVFVPSIVEEWILRFAFVPSIVEEQILHFVFVPSIVGEQILRFFFAPSIVENQILRFIFVPSIVEEQILWFVYVPTFSLGTNEIIILRSFE